MTIGKDPDANRTGCECLTYREREWFRHIILRGTTQTRRLSNGGMLSSATGEGRTMGEPCERTAAMGASWIGSINGEKQSVQIERSGLEGAREGVVDGITGPAMVALGHFGGF